MRKLLLGVTLLALQAAAAEAGTVVLFDNMNRTAGPVTYDCCHAYGVEGPQNLGIYSKIAVAFTPQVNASVTEIDAPISWWSGPNGTTMGLYADDHDMPGRLIRQWVFHNLPGFNTCCSYLAATWPNGIAVIAGRQNWVVAQTDGTMLDTITLWNENSTTTVQNKMERWCKDSPMPGGAVCAPEYMSGTWTQEFGSPRPALAVIGKN